MERATAREGIGEKISQRFLLFYSIGFPVGLRCIYQSIYAKLIDIRTGRGDGVDEIRYCKNGACVSKRGHSKSRMRPGNGGGCLLART